VIAAWPTVTLGDICTFKYGKALRGESRSGEGLQVFGSNGAVGHHNEALTSGPAVIVGRKGSFGEVHYADGPCWPIDTTYYIDRTSTNADLRWLFYRVGSLGLTSLNRAAAIPGLNREDAYRQTLLMPPIDEQRRIAAVLDQADDLRAKRRASLELLDSLIESTFLELFGDPTANKARFPTRALGHVGEVVTGNTPSRKKREYYGDAIEWIKSDNIVPPRPYLTCAREGLSAAGRRVGRVAPAGSVLVTCIAGSPASIGNCAIADRPVSFNQQINALIPRKDDVVYLHALLLVSKRVVQAASTASMKGMISKSRFEAIRLPIAPLDLQVRFTERARVIRDREKSTVRSKIQMERLFASLQQRAFAGEL